MQWRQARPTSGNSDYHVFGEIIERKDFVIIFIATSLKNVRYIEFPQIDIFAIWFFLNLAVFKNILEFLRFSVFERESLRSYMPIQSKGMRHVYQIKNDAL